MNRYKHLDVCVSCGADKGEPCRWQDEKLVKHVHTGRQYISGRVDKELDKHIAGLARVSVEKAPRGIWLGASQILGFSVRLEEEYFCICGRLSPHTGNRIRPRECGAEVHIRFHR